MNTKKEEVVAYINDVVSTAYGNPAVLNVTICEVGGAKAVEMHLRTSLTAEELDKIRREYSICEIYGMDATHFAENPTSNAQLGLIVH